MELFTLKHLVHIVIDPNGSYKDPKYRLTNAAIRLTSSNDELPTFADLARVGVDIVDLANDALIVKDSLGYFLKSWNITEPKTIQNLVVALKQMAKAYNDTDPLLSVIDKIIDQMLGAWDNNVICAMLFLNDMEEAHFHPESAQVFVTFSSQLRAAIKPILRRDWHPDFREYSRLKMELVQCATALDSVRKNVEDALVKEEPSLPNPSRLCQTIRGTPGALTCMAVTLCARDKRVNDLGTPLRFIDRGEHIELSVGWVWTHLSHLWNKHFEIPEIKKITDRLDITILLRLNIAHSAQKIDDGQYKTVSMFPNAFGKMRSADEIIEHLVQWDQAGRPRNFNEFMQVGGTTQSWQSHQGEMTRLEVERKDKAQARRKRANEKITQARSAPVSNKRQDQICTGNKRHHRGFAEPIEKKQINWNSLWNSIREIVPQEHLPNQDPQLVAAILLTLMRSGDKILQHAKWPHLKANKLRSRVRKFMPAANSREIDGACRVMLKVKLLKQQGGKLFISDRAPRNPEIASVRSRLITLASNTNA